MRLVAVQIIGWILLAFGVLFLLLPIPLGILFTLVALVILLPTTPAFAAFLRRRRQRWSAFNRFMAYLTRRAPLPYRRVLRTTEPGDFV